MVKLIIDSKNTDYITILIKFAFYLGEADNKSIQIMSKIILGGEEFYKMKWDELLENDWGWSGNRSFKLGIREDFS